MERQKYKPGHTPSAVKGVKDCLVCGFVTSNPLGVHKLRPKDFALIDRVCKDETDRRKITIAKWNECCGSFNGYQITLIEDIDGKPYAGAEESKITA